MPSIKSCINKLKKKGFSFDKAADQCRFEAKEKAMKEIDEAQVAVEQLREAEAIGEIQGSGFRNKREGLIALEYLLAGVNILMILLWMYVGFTQKDFIVKVIYLNYLVVVFFIFLIARKYIRYIRRGDIRFVGIKLYEK